MSGVVNIKNMTKRKRWSEEEEVYLIENYGKIDTKEIASKLQRTVASINWRAKSLNLSESRGKSWTTKEIELLLSDSPEKEIAEKLNRTVTAVRKKRAIVRAKKGFNFKKSKLKDLFDLSAIDEGVPNINRFSASSQHFALLHALAVGQSYEFPESEYAMLRNQVQLIPDKEFSTRKWTEKTRRVWRTK